MEDTSAITGSVVVELRDADGNLKCVRHVENLITDAGDQYYITRGIAAVSPATPSDATKVTGMKLGTGTTAVAKNGAGAALVTYISGSNKTFDTSFPAGTSLGAGLGYTGTYQATWGAGVATNGAITEAVIVNDASTDATTTAANTISRIVFTAIPKGASDTLTISWAHKMLGA